MSYHCSDWRRFEHGTSRFYGNGQCAVFVEMVTGAPRVHSWRRGLKVLGNGHLITPGTAIATFNSHGVYPNMNHGNHAALFVSENGHSITVIDQYHGTHSHHPGISRYSHQGHGDDHHMTGDPEYYYVIE
ncbi:MAG: BPSL0067 family protein [Minicystis sp.]